MDPRVGYARHAISIDERRADFKRVKWGEGRRIERPAMERLEQFWFAGNHADIGGGYLENESRLSDIALGWMVAAASDSLGERGLIRGESKTVPESYNNWTFAQLRLLYSEALQRSGRRQDIDAADEVNRGGQRIFQYFDIAPSLLYSPPPGASKVRLPQSLSAFHIVSKRAWDLLNQR